MMLWELPKRSTHPEQCRNVIDRKKAFKFALEVIKKYPDMTRKELKEVAGHEAGERAGQRAHDLGCAKLIDRRKCPVSGQYRNTINEKGEKFLTINNGDIK